jgi:hypothetical protein
MLTPSVKRETVQHSGQLQVLGMGHLQLLLSGYFLRVAPAVVGQGRVEVVGGEVVTMTALALGQHHCGPST